MREHKIVFKGLYIIVLAIFLAISCNKELLPGPKRINKNGNYSLKQNGISITDIYEYNSKKCANEKINRSIISIDPIISEGDTVLYLVNYDKGWEILSADKRAPRSFAMSDGGSLAVSQLSDIPALECLYDKFKSNVLYLKQNPELSILTDFKDKWERDYRSRTVDWELIDSTAFYTDSTQNHLTVTRWGQGSPWNCRSPYTNNTLTTHCVTGCVPVAAAQVLYYIHHKEGIPLAAFGDCTNLCYIPNGDDYVVLNPDDVVFDYDSYLQTTWNNMPLTTVDSGSFAAVSTLMTQLGLNLGAKYYVNATGATTSNVQYVFNDDFGVDCNGSSAIDFQTIANQIFVNNLPVILSISRIDNTGTHGHCIIADACRENYEQKIYFYRRLKPIPVDDPFEYPWEFKTEQVNNLISRYIGINWGWNGAFMESEGETIWFNTDIISWSVGPYNYTSVNYMIYGFGEI